MPYAEFTVIYDTARLQQLHQMRERAGMAPITDVQMLYTLMTQGEPVEREILTALAEEGKA